MNNVHRLARWFCSMLTRGEFTDALVFLLEVHGGRREDVEFKKQFREQHPNYRQYDVDTTPPLTDPPGGAPDASTLDWRELLSGHRARKGRPLKPVSRRNGQAPLADCRCERCGAPSEWLYVNDGRKRSQLRCKVCGSLFPMRRVRDNAPGPFWCPWCGNALFRWKHSGERTIYKCPNRKCPHYRKAYGQLNLKERLLVKTGMSSQFKLHYQWRSYHFDPATIRPQGPQSDPASLRNVRRSLESVGLALAYAVSFGLSARMTSRVLREIHGIPVSHQTVLNWMESAAPLAWNVLGRTKGAMADMVVAADETYIKILGAWHYTWFAIGTESHAIMAWDVSDNRGQLPAVGVINQALDARDPNVPGTMILVGDGNPSYDAATNAVNSDADGMPLPPGRRRVERITVVGLRDDDEVSRQFRSFKQMIERLNRTYRYHTRSCSGHKSVNGAVALTTLFVAHYNFLRPHQALGRRVPLPLPELDGIRTIQGKWLKLLQLAG